MYKVYLLLFCLTLKLSTSLGTDENENSLPVRIVNHPKTQIGLRSNQIVFNCEYELSQQNLGLISSPSSFDSDSFIHVKWLFNLTPISIKQGSDLLTERNKLIIRSFDPSTHVGQYRCLINNTLFSPPLVILSEPANLTLASKCLHIISRLL